MSGKEGSVRSGLSSAKSASSNSSTGAPRSTAAILRQKLITKSQKRDFRYVWTYKIKPAVIQTLINLNRKPVNGLYTCLASLVEFLQLISFCFLGNWDTSGNNFAYGIKLLTVGGNLSRTENILISLSIIGVCFILVCLMAFFYLIGYDLTNNTASTFSILFFRWTVTLMTSILFIPLLEIFLLSIKDGSNSLVGLGSVGLIMLLSTSITSSLLFYQNHSSASTPFNKLSPLVDFLALIQKLAVVSVGVLQSTLFVTPLVSMIFSIITMIYVIVKLPCYRKSANKALFCFAAINFWAGLIGSAITANNSPPNQPFTAFVLLSLATGSIGMFMFSLYYDRRIKRLYLLLKKDLKQDSSIEAYEEKLRNMNMQFKSAEDVERTARFIRDDLVMKLDREVATNIAKAIYSIGFGQFDNDPIMLCLYGSFLGLYCNDNQAWKSYIENASVIDPKWYLKLKIANFRTQREESSRTLKGSGDGMLDTLDLAEIKSSLKAASRKTAKIKSHVAELWKLLLTGKVDAEKIQRLTSKVVLNKTYARTLIEKTVMRYPRHLPALKMYAKFLDEVEHEYEDGKDIWNVINELLSNRKPEIKKYNEDLPHEGGAIEIIKASNQAIDVDNNSDKRSDASDQVQLKAAMTQSSDSSSISSNSKRITMPSKTWKRYNEYKESLRNIKSNSIPNFNRIIKLSFILFLAAPIIQLAWLQSGNGKIITNIDNIKISGLRRDLSANYPLKMLYMKDMIGFNSSAPILDFIKYHFPNDYVFGEYVQFPGQNYSVPREFEYFRNSLLELLDEFEAIQFKLFFSIDQKAPMFLKWLVPSVPLKFYLGSEFEDPIWDNPLNFFDASSEFWRHARNVLRVKDPIQYFTDPNLIYEVNWRYCMDNMVNVYGKAFDEGTSDFTDENERNISYVIMICWAILGALAASAVITGLFLLRPTIGKVFRELDLATAALLAVPRNSIEAHYGKVKEYMNIHNKTKNSGKLFAPSEESDERAETESEEENDEDEISDVDTGAESSSSSIYGRAKSFVVYTTSYIIALMLIIGVLAFNTYLLNAASQTLVQIGIRTDISNSIGFSIMAIGYTVNVLRNPDNHTSAILPQFQSDLQNHLGTFGNLQVALLFGDPSRGLELGRLPERTQKIMFTKRFFGNKNSLDETVNVFLKSLNVLLRTPVPFAKDDPEVESVLLRVPIINSGFDEVTDVNMELLFEELTYRKSLSIGLFFVALVSFAFIYLTLFSWLVKRLEFEHQKSEFILMQIPLESLKINYPLQVLLRGSEEARDYFKTEDIPGVTITKDGIPMPDYSVTNLDYVQSVVNQSFTNLSSIISHSIFRKKKKVKKLVDKAEEDLEEKDIQKQDDDEEVVKVKQNPIIHVNDEKINSNQNVNTLEVGKLVSTSIDSADSENSQQLDKPFADLPRRSSQIGILRNGRRGSVSGDGGKRSVRFSIDIPVIPSKDD